MSLIGILFYIVLLNPTHVTLFIDISLMGGCVVLNSNFNRAVLSVKSALPTFLLVFFFFFFHYSGVDYSMAF